jgi:ABC-type cobalamin/Fe3+-siderophores transport system ATPase subunit
MHDEVLRLDGVWKAFERGRERVSVLEGVSLDVALGKIAAVVGSAGQGKTTLIRIASGTLRADQGEVLLHGQDLDAFSSEDYLAREMGLATKEGEDKLEVRASIEMSLSATCEYSKRDRKRLVEATMRDLDITDCASARWHELSNWQRVLVEFAQAVVRRPPLLLIDDLVDGLPFEHKRTAMDLIERYAKEIPCAVLMTASDHTTAARAAKVWTLAHHKLELMHTNDPDVTYLHDRQRRAAIEPN